MNIKKWLISKAVKALTGNYRGVLDQAMGQLDRKRLLQDLRAVDRRECVEFADRYLRGERVIGSRTTGTYRADNTALVIVGDGVCIDFLHQHGWPQAERERLLHDHDANSNRSMWLAIAPWAHGGLVKVRREAAAYSDFVKSGHG